MFIKEIKELPSPDKLPENLKKLMIFDDVEPKERIIKECFCIGRHINCNMINLNQNLFSLDGRGVRENCNLIILFQQEVVYFIHYIKTSLMKVNLIIKILLL